MSDRGAFRHPAYFVIFGVLAILLIFGGSLLVLAYFAPKPLPGYLPFFPFGIFWAFLLIFLVFGIIRWAFWGWGWRRRAYYGRYYGYYDQAHQILRERYARGEISKEQLDQMTRDLDQHN